MNLRRTAIAFAVAALGATLPAAATSPVNKSLFGGVAIEGYDPVAYFTDGKPVEGSKAHTFAWQGATWRFASAEHRALFAADPEKYAPQYGGYCAYAVGNGYTAGIDPEAWTIHDGKLYLNYDLEVQAKWLADRDALIAKADLNWPALLSD
jgi:YHS domain-containing protein